MMEKSPIPAQRQLAEDVKEKRLTYAYDQNGLIPLKLEKQMIEEGKEMTII